MPRGTELTISVRVQRGDTLSGIAARVNGTTTAGLAQLNGLPDANRLREGQLLLVPSQGTSLEVTVRRGDTLTSLARRFGTSVEALCSADQTRRERPLRVGQRLRVPASPRHDTSLSPTKPSALWRPTQHSSPKTGARSAADTTFVSPWGAASGIAVGRPATVASWPRFEHPSVGRPENQKPTESDAPAARPPQQLDLGHALRYASAANSTLENLTRLGASQVAAVGLVGAAVATARLPGETATFLRDLRTHRPADAFESGSKVARNIVRAVRGLEVLACALGSRSLSRVIPGASAAAALIDSGIATATQVNPRASQTERRAATLAALASTISALSVPILSALAGVAAAGLGLWRDALSDDRRAATP